jgi:hypothetical protein
MIRYGTRLQLLISWLDGVNYIPRQVGARHSTHIIEQSRAEANRDEIVLTRLVSLTNEPSLFLCFLFFFVC